MINLEPGGNYIIPNQTFHLSVISIPSIICPAIPNP